MRINYAFDFCAEIVSEKPFNDIPVKDLCAAMRARLDRVEKDSDMPGAHEAFNCFDQYEEEENPIQF